MNKSNVSSLIKAGNKIILAVLGTLFLLILYFTLTGFYENLKLAKKNTLEQLQGIATAASMMIDSEEIDRLKAKLSSSPRMEDPNADSSYFNIYITLKDLQVRNKLNTSINILTYDEQKGYFNYLVTSYEKPNFKEELHEFPLTLLQNYHNGDQIELYQNQHGQWLSAFSPIKDQDGKTVAIVLVDKSFQEFKALANKHLLRDLIISGIVFLIIGFSVYKFISSLINREQRIRRRLIEQNEEIVSQKEEIQQQSNWISEHNLKLEEQAKTIALQNKELKIINQMLDFKVEQRTKELEKANSELSEFLYRSSHDIVGPIATLSGLVNVAKKDLSDQLTQAYLLRMDNTIDQLNSVIRSINVVYEIRNRELDYRKERIEDLVRTTIKSQEHIALKNGVEISYEIEEGMEASIDDFLVRIALAELIKNACSFHSQETGKKPFHAKVSVGYYKKNKIKFTIEDNGMGIDPGYEHLIFQMFKKATVNSGGAGLGLYVAMLAVERIKGKIKYSPNGDSGAKFEMVFPIFDKIQLKSFSLN